MRKVVGYLLTAALILAVLLAPGWLKGQVTRAQAAPPVIKLVAPDTMPAGSDAFTLRLEGKNLVDGTKVFVDNTLLASPRVAGKKGKVLLAEMPASLLVSPGTRTVRAVSPDGVQSEAATLTVVSKDPDISLQLEGNSVQEEPGTAVEFEVSGEGFTDSSVALTWGFEAAATTFISETRLRIQIAEKYLADPASIPIIIHNRGGKFSNAE